MSMKTIKEIEHEFGFHLLQINNNTKLLEEFKTLLLKTEKDKFKWTHGFLNEWNTQVISDKKTLLAIKNNIKIHTKKIKNII